MMDKQEAELLNITLEECAEVTQAISKVFRFGWEGRHPVLAGQTNRQHLEEEVGDLLCMIELLGKFDILDAEAVAHAKKDKLTKLAMWSGIHLPEE